jgi:hypothetical protein
MVQVTFLDPLKNLDDAGFLSLVREQYGIG